MTALIKEENTMSFNASWIHGNALIVQMPGNLVSTDHVGWGTDMKVKPGTSTWFHIPLPTPVVIDGTRSKLIRVFIMFQSDIGGRIESVHVYDGTNKIHQFDGLRSEGDNRVNLNSYNTFTLPAPHDVIFGIGISFSFVTAIGIDSPIPPFHLVVVSAGGDYTT
jgi:hypothetical protein